MGSPFNVGYIKKPSPESKMNKYIGIPNEMLSLFDHSGKLKTKSTDSLAESGKSGILPTDVQGRPDTLVALAAIKETLYTGPEHSSN